MDHQAHQLDNAALAHSGTSNTLDFNSVIDLKAYAGKSEKIDIDTTVTERPTGPGGSEKISVNERVHATEDGKPITEHVANDLTVRENGHDTALRDHTAISEGSHAARGTSHTETIGAEKFAPSHDGQFDEKFDKLSSADKFDKPGQQPPPPEAMKGDKADRYGGGDPGPASVHAYLPKLEIGDGK